MSVTVPLELLLFGCLLVGALLGGVIGFLIARIAEPTPLPLLPIEPVWTSKTTYGFPPKPQQPTDTAR